MATAPKPPVTHLPHRTIPGLAAHPWLFFLVVGTAITIGLYLSR